MSQSQSRPLNMSQFNSNSQCVDSAAEMDNWFDFSNLASPTPGTSQARMSSSQATSGLTSPTSNILPLEAIEEHAVLQPSHEYSRFKQQTGLPTSVEHLHRLSSSQSSQGFPNYSSGMEDMNMGFGSMVGDLGLGLDSGNNSNMSFLFPSQGSEFIDPTDIVKEEEAQANMRIYPGMHQQQAAARQAEQQRQMMLQKQKQEAERQRQQVRRSVSNQPLDQRTEETIARVVNQIRQSSSMSADAMSPSGNLPHVIRARKDEDDMDEDERLLNSEEGKKLSSKERRQLRNKVSARAFRSRRKEYIGQLEGEVAARSNEAKELQRQNHALMEENARFRSLAEKLLAHPAFHPFLDELSRDPALAESLSKVSGSAMATSATPAPAPAAKDVDPFSGPQQFLTPQNNIQHVGMTLIPETPIDMSSLSLGPANGGWALPNGMSNFQQVFAVTELPSIPESLDVEALSGKSSDDIVSEFTSSDDEIKHDYAEIEAPRKCESVIEERPQQATETVEEECSLDENDPTFALFAAPSRSAKKETKAVEDFEPIFGNIAPEKAFARFELFVSSEQDNTALMHRFERMTARLEASSRRLDNLMAFYQ